MTLVTVRVQNDLPSPGVVAGVWVDFYTTSAVFQTNGVTDSSGNVVVSLPDGTYDVGFFKQGVSITGGQPQRIVVDTLLSNVFLVTCHVRTMPESIDPRKCKVSGYILSPVGSQNKSRLIFCPVTDLIVYDVNIVDIQSRFEVSSDDAGYFEFELLRKQNYDAYFLYLDSFMGIIPPAKLLTIVPDHPAIELHKLLFPLPVRSTFSASTITIPLDSDPDDSLTVVTSWTDGSDRWASYAWAGLEVLTDDNKVVEASVSAGTVVLKPLSAGVAHVTINRLLPSKASFDPLAAFASDTLTVTVG